MAALDRIAAPGRSVGGYLKKKKKKPHYTQCQYNFAQGEYLFSKKKKKKMPCGSDLSLTAETAHTWSSLQSNALLFSLVGHLLYLI